jgi:hypothetical protein
MINLYVTEEQLHTIHSILGHEFIKLSEAKKNPNTTLGQITERQYARCLDALAVTSKAVDKHYYETN